MKHTHAFAHLPTKFGNFVIRVWPAEKGLEPIALITQNLDITKPVHVRLHSECITGDTFGSLRCDCGEQKEKSLRMIHNSKNGIFIYLRQEGRGIGLFEKIKAYALQEQGYDTHEANILLGFNPDPREYSIAKDILSELHIQQIKLITNNLSKVTQLRSFGFNVLEQIPLIIKSNKFNKKYLETKEIKMNHLLHTKQKNYFFGISGVTKPEEVRSIASFVKHNLWDPLARVSIGINVHSFLTSEKEQKMVTRLFKEIKRFDPEMVPVLHYSFINSRDYMQDIEFVVKHFPFVKKIQLNDLEKDHIKTLQFACKYFAIQFPLNDTSFSLLESPVFIHTVRKNDVTILLDNSGGKGIQEAEEIYKKKIQNCLNHNINVICLAGGFGPNQLGKYFSLRDYFKINFSIDAQTKLQKNGALDITKVLLYLKQLLSLTALTRSSRK